MKGLGRLVFSIPVLLVPQTRLKLHKASRTAGCSTSTRYNLLSEDNITVVHQDGTNNRALGSSQLLALVDLVIGVETSGDYPGAEEF